MQIKTTMRYHITHVRMVNFKKTTNYKCLHGCWEKGSFQQFGENVGFYSHLYGKQPGVSSKTKTSIKSRISTPRFCFFQKKKKKIEFKNYMNSNVHSNVLYNSQNINVSIRYRRYGVYIHTHNKTDDTTLIAESKEELKSFLMKVKEESEKSWLKAQHSEN